MKLKTFKLLLLFTLICSLILQVSYVYSYDLNIFMPYIDNITIVPSFETASVYIPFASGSTAQCKIFYKRKTNNMVLTDKLLLGFEYDWKQAYNPVYISGVSQFSGSIVDLRENSVYEVKAEIYQNGTLVKLFSTDFRTLSDNPPIGRIIKLSDIYSGGALNLTGYQGNPSGWIKIVGDENIKVDGGNVNTAAINISDCKYLIIENVIVKGGKRHGIYLASTCDNIRISNCDISSWGRVGILKHVSDSQVHYYDTETDAMIDHDCGIYYASAKNIVIEKNYIHDPNGNSNFSYGWVTIDGVQYRVEGSHPAGPNAIYGKSTGSVVIRYNDLIGVEGHRWNDAIEGYNNNIMSGGVVSKDCDIYGNMIAMGQDDGIELDGGQANVRVFKNRIEYFYSYISTTPNIVGPSYIYKNLMPKIGDEVNKSWAQIKAGSLVTSYGTSFMFNNTILDGRGTGVAGVGSNATYQFFNGVTRNNIVTESSSNADCIYEGASSAISSFDYDLLGNTQIADGKGTLNIKSNPSQQERNALYGLPTFKNAQFGDYRLAKSSLGYKAAALINGFDSQNMGAYDNSDSSLAPYRPITVVSDKYHIDINSNLSNNITLTNNGYKGMNYRILLSKDVWGLISTSPTKGTISAKGQIHLKINVGNITKLKYKAYVIIKFDNGYSIPVSLLIN